MIEPQQQEISTVARSGGLSLRQTTTVANAGSYQDITGLIPGRPYQFVAWARSESGDVQAALKVSDTTGANMVTAWGTGYDSMWWAVYTTFTATAEGKARVKLEKPTTDGVLLWDDVEVMPTYDSCGKAVKLKYYPYGQEVGTVTANDRVKFGTYTRDAATGLDYAMNRYYQSTWGRFTSPDPYRASGGPGDPGSWNRYAYVQGDPVNRMDPSGLNFCAAEFSFADCLGIQYDIDTGFISTGGGGGGGTLGGPIGSPQCSGLSGIFNPACWGPIALLPIAVPDLTPWKPGPPELCGVNPVTGTAGIAPMRTGIPGQLRPGDGGDGYYWEPRRNKLGRHSGIDIAGIAGESPIYASLGGKITTAADLGGAAGKTVGIDVGGRYSMWYMHLDSIAVKVGDVVTMGQNIGVLGQTGNGGGPLSEAHVHFEVRFGGKPGYRNPITWLNSPCPPGVNAW